jgi:hypothetical protein
MASANVDARDRQWFIVGRWQQYEGESRANLLRIVAVGAFYAIQLIQYHFLEAPSAAADKFHSAATLLSVAWILLSVAVMLCLRRRIFPAALKYASTLCDLVLLTALVATFTEAKANSPLVLAYFLIIALAGLRFSLPLVWTATLGAMLGYLYLVGQTDDAWFDSNHAVPVVQQLVTLLSLGLTGILLGQILRRVRSLAEDYAERIGKAQKLDS